MPDFAHINAGLLDLATIGDPPPGLPAGELVFALRLPLPPSTNDLYAPGKGGQRRMSDRAREFRQQARALVLERRGVLNVKPTTARLAIAMRLIAATARDCDVANIEKATTDALEGVVYANDAQIDWNLQFRGEAGSVKGGAVDVWIRTLAP